MLPRCKQMTAPEGSLAVVHITGRANGGWKLLMQLYGGKSRALNLNSNRNVNSCFL